jgi:uncharacterized membrane protein YfhO
MELGDSFDPLSEVVLAQGTPAPPTPGFEGSCRIRVSKPDRIELDASLSGPGYLVLVDTFDPNWRVSVDGVSSPLLRANVCFRAVALGGGHHAVGFSYRPVSLYLGTVLSLSAVLLAVGLLRVRSR